jgi:S1-C subfamily serine protease
MTRLHESKAAAKVMLRGAVLFLAALVSAWSARPASAGTSFAEVIASVQPKIVKIYGAGGLQGLEAYQSGFLISAEGHVLTVWSYVLDTDYVTVTLDDGRKFQAELVGHDPRLEVAILKIDALALPHFNLEEAVELDSGARVLAFSNLYGVATGNEPASVLHGSVSARATLDARRGAFQTTYSGPVYVLDAMTNNPGASGGALTDGRGQLAGILGKELRSAQANTWLNYSIPVAELVTSVDDILSGKIIPRRSAETTKKPLEAISLPLLGIVLVPDVLSKTPPFVDKVRPGSPAEKAGLRVDDLVLFVNNRIVPSSKSLVEELTYFDRDDEVRLTVQRGQELIEIVIAVQN